MRPFRLPQLLVLAGILVACSDPGGPQAAAIAISPRVTSLALGDSLQLTATVTDGSGNPLSGVAVNWTTADSTVLTVSNSGLVRALASGLTTITATAGTAHDALGVTVAIKFSSVSQGGSSVVCAVATTHDGYCRGHNEFGELGNGTTDSSTVFVPVAGGLKFTVIQPGLESTCGLATDSAAYCWGLGEFGGLGSGDTVTRHVPNAVVGGLRFTDLAQGDLHTCALTAASSTYCWGWGYYGATGDSALGNWTSPTPVSSAPAFVSLVAGGYSTCGLTAAHDAFCWGLNYFGQLGTYTDTIFHNPGPVTGGHTFQTLSLHEPDCGLATDGTVYCWAVVGRNTPFPTALPGGLRFTSISTAYPHGCGVATDSTVYCWLPGQMPDLVPGGQAYGQVASGIYHDCGLTTDSVAYCWLFHCGRSLDVECTDPPSPAAVPGGLRFSRISSAGDNNTCGLTPSGTVYCWYVGLDSGSAVPTAVPGSIVFRTVVVGENNLDPLISESEHGCGLAEDSIAYCWGFERNLQGGGIAVLTSAPVPVPGGLKYLSLDTWGSHVCGIAPGGAAYCWGRLDAAPSPVPGGGSFVSIFTSYESDCALTAEGTAYCWGSNSYGQLGLGFSSSQSFIPLPVLGGHSFVTLTMETDHTCGLTVDSVAYCWGLNSTGMLGTGDTVNSIPPRAVATGLRFASLTAGPYITCGLVADGSAYCWGRGTFTPAPQQAGTHFTSLSANNYVEACGTTTSGDVSCFGLPDIPAGSHRTLTPHLRRSH